MRWLFSQFLDCGDDFTIVFGIGRGEREKRGMAKASKKSGQSRRQKKKKEKERRKKKKKK